MELPKEYGRLKAPQLVKRWVSKEIPRIKEKYPLTITSGEYEQFVVVTQPSLVRPGKPIIVAISMGPSWPFKEPEIQVVGYSISSFGKWSPQTMLVDYIGKIFDDIRSAENDPEFREGKWYEYGSVIALNKDPNLIPVKFTNVKSCALCMQPAQALCGGPCRTTFYCSQTCASLHYPQHVKECKQLGLQHFH